MKLISILLIIVSTLSLAGCSKSNTTVSATEATTESTTSQDKSADTKTDINIAVLKGPTAIGMVKLMSDSELGNTDNNYNFTISATADEIVPKIVKGELDIATVPANLSSVLFNNTEGKISVAAINTLGVLYVVQSDSNEQINSIQDLKGKTILSTGKGTTPEYVLNYILSSNGIDPTNDINIEYKSESAEVVANLQASDTNIAVLPEPYVTTAKSKIELKTVLDLTKEWDNIDSEGSLITGVVIARNEFLNENKEAFNKFLEEYKSSTEFVNNDIEQSSTLVEKYGIVPSADIAKKAIPNCNITFIEGNEMEQKLNGYLQILFNQNPKSIGGKLPDEKFYYKR